MYDLEKAIAEVKLNFTSTEESVIKGILDAGYDKDLLDVFISAIIADGYIQGKLDTMKRFKDLGKGI